MASVTDFDSDPEDISTIPFYASEEDVDELSAYPDVYDVSSGDASFGQGAAGPYTAAPYAADQGMSSDDAALLYEVICDVSDNLVSARDAVCEGLFVVSIFLGFISGLLLVIGLWLGGRR